MVNLTAAERVYEYWIDKASSAADLVLKIVFAVILFLVARKLILWLCGLIRKNMRRFHTEEAVVSFTVSMVKYSLNTLLADFYLRHSALADHAAGADHYRSARHRIRSVDRSSHRLRRRCRIPGIAGRPLKLCRRGDDSAAEAI